MNRATSHGSIGVWSTPCSIRKATPPDGFLLNCSVPAVISFWKNVQIDNQWKLKYSKGLRGWERTFIFFIISPAMFYIKPNVSAPIQEPSSRDNKSEHCSTSVLPHLMSLFLRNCVLYLIKYALIQMFHQVKSQKILYYNSKIPYCIMYMYLLIIDSLSFKVLTCTYM